MVLDGADDSKQDNEPDTRKFKVYGIFDKDSKKLTIFTISATRFDDKIRKKTTI